MERKMTISHFINIKNRFWVLLMAGSFLLSSCGCGTSNRETGESPVLPVEEKDAENLGVIEEGIVETKPEEESASENVSTHKKGKFDEYGEQYSRIETEDGGYEVTLYDKEGNVVHTEIYPKLLAPPGIEEKTDNILQIVMTGGNISALIFYYDKERAIVSPYYTESFYLRDNYVAYMEDERTLVLTDIFGDGELYKEINRNFSDSRHLGGMRLSIKGVTMITLNNRDVVVLEYYEGEERELITEIIPLEEEVEEIAFNRLDEIERNYEVLQYDICNPVLYVFEDINPVVRRRIEYEVENHEEISQKYGKELEIAIDYHTFDFNDDGVDDYLVCIDRELYDGRVEHWIYIYITKQEKGWIGGRYEREMVDEMAYQVLELNLPQYDQADEDGHKQVMVLKEQTEGYHAIVLPGSNLILRYDGRYFEYEFCDQ